MKAWPVSLDARPTGSRRRPFRSPLVASSAWQSPRRGLTHDQQAADKFERLLAQLRPATPALLSEQALSDVFSNGLGEALRYLAGPPISDDDLQSHRAEWTVCRQQAVERQRCVGAHPRLHRAGVDPHRLPVDRAAAASRRSRSVTPRVLASSVLLAAQRVETERRMQGKNGQESDLKTYLSGLSMTEASAGAHPHHRQGPGRRSVLWRVPVGRQGRSVDALTTGVCWPSRAKTPTAPPTASSA